MKYTSLLGAATLAICSQSALAQNTPTPANEKNTTNDSRDIIVTATPFGHGIDDTPAITAKINSQDILRRGGGSIADTLAAIPGIASSGFAAGASRPIIRGMDSSRVRLLENGTSSSDVSDIGPDHGIPLDPLAARSIEVIRGAGTLRYGSQAIGGVVNVLNDRVPQKLGQKPFLGELTGSFASVSNAWQGSALMDANLGNMAVHADIFGRQADDYNTPSGTQANSFFRGHGGSIGASWLPGGEASGSNNRIGAAVIQYNARYGIPSDDTFIDMKQTKVIARSAFTLGQGLLDRLNLDASYANYRHFEREPDGTIVSTFLNTEYDVHAEAVTRAIGPIDKLALGFEYQDRAFSALGNGSNYLMPAKTSNAGTYLFADMKLGNSLHAEASGRIESVKVRGTPISGVPTQRSFTPVSGALGLLFKPTNSLKLGLNASSTARAPGIIELFARGPHDGPGTYEMGDPALKPERAKSLELSVRLRQNRFNFDGSIYSSWFSNYIYGALTGRNCDENGLCAVGSSEPLREMNYAEQDAHFRGFEGETSYDLVQGTDNSLTARLFGDYTRATFANGTNVPRIPAWRLGGGLSWKSRTVDVGSTLTYTGQQNNFGAFDTPTPGYTALGIDAAWRPFSAYSGVEFILSAENLTNSDQRLATSFNKDVVAMPGRSVRLTLRIANF